MRVRESQSVYVCVWGGGEGYSSEDNRYRMGWAMRQWSIDDQPSAEILPTTAQRDPTEISPAVRCMQMVNCFETANH